MDWSELKDSHIRQVADSRSYERGLACFQEGAVLELHHERGIWHALVAGSRSRPYRVRIRGRPEDMQISCTCPYEDVDACKHVVAVLLDILWQAKPTAQPDDDASRKAQQRLEQLLRDLDAEQLRRFVRLQAAEVEGLLEDLEIFNRGTAETDRTVEQYVQEMTSALKGTQLLEDEDEPEDFDGDEEEDGEDDFLVFGSYYRDEDEDDDFDTEEYNAEVLDRALSSYRDAARKYLAQGNWREAAKIEEALVRACAGLAKKVRACDQEAGDALRRWGTALAAAEPAQARQQALGRLAGLFAEGAAGCAAKDWDAALGAIACTKKEAQAFLQQLPQARLRKAQSDPARSTALLRVLQAAGQDEAYVETARQAVRQDPRLGAAVGERLVQMGRRDEAIELLEQALGQTQTFAGQSFVDARKQPLQRALLGLYDPKRDRKKLVKQARTLLFEAGTLQDYLLLRDALDTPAQREKLLQELAARCLDAGLVLEVLAHEARFDLLPEAARRLRHEQAFPQMLRRLGERDPRQAFELWRERLLELLQGVSHMSVYTRIAEALREMRQFPGQEEAFWDLVADIVLQNQRRPGLRQALGGLVQESHERQAAKLRALQQSTTPAERRDMGLEELMRLCPIAEADRLTLERHRIYSTPNTARRVWAILAQNGGPMQAADISLALVAAGMQRLVSARSTCSVGLKILEALGLATVDRSGGRLGLVRLLDGPAPEPDRGDFRKGWLAT